LENPGVSTKKSIDSSKFSDNLCTEQMTGTPIKWQSLFLYIAGAFVFFNFSLYFPHTKHNLAIFALLNVIFMLAAVIISKIQSERLFCPKNSLILVILLSASLFLYKYGGIKYFNSFIFQDDYPTLYYATEQGMKMAWQGGVFGWDSVLFGGYYNIVNPTNLAFFVWPFVLILGLKTGLNLFYFLAFIIFSPLIYIYSRNIINDKKINIACLWISFFVLCSFFRNTLKWGNIEVFLCLELLILNLILCELFLKRAKLSSFFLTASLSLTLFRHPAFFLYSLLIILIRILLDKDIKDFVRYVYILFFVFLSILPFTYPIIKYNYYFSVGSSYHRMPLNKMFSDIAAYILGPFKNEAILSLKAHLSNWIATPIIGYESYITILSVVSPLFLYICLFQKNNFKKIILSLVIFSLIIETFARLETPITSRNHFVLVILIIFSLGYFIALHHNKIFSLMVVFFIIAYCFLFPPGYIFEKIRTESSINEYNPALIKKVKKLEGNLLLFEQRGCWNYINQPKEGEMSEQPRYDIHFECLITRQTKKRFFSGAGEGYHFHIDRYNTFIGIFQRV